MTSTNTMCFNPHTHFERWNLLRDLDENTIASIKWFKPLDKRVFYYTHDDRLFAWGKNDWGKLGVGHKNDVDTPTLVVGLEGQHVVDIAGSEEITLALTQHGRVYAWGRNNAKQIEDSHEDCIPRPKHMQDLNNTVSIACGRAHSMALDKHGKMFIWGWNGNGQIGNNSTNTPSHPIQLDTFTTEVITQIECGARNSMVLLDNGDVWAWGLLFGQNNLTPVKLNVSNHQVKQIACAHNALVSLTHQGQIFIHRVNVATPQLMQPQDIQFTSVIIIDHNKFDWDREESLVLANSVTQQVYRTNVKEDGNIQFTKSSMSLPDVIVHCSIIQVSPLKMTLNSSNEHDQVVALSKQIIDSFDREDGSDLVFSFPKEDKKIYAHRFFLSFLSPYMRTMLSKRWAKEKEVKENEIEENEIRVTEYSYGVYYNYVRYLYTHSLPVDTLPDLIHLYDLAKCNLEKKLKDDCMRLISQLLNVGNCFELYGFSVTYSQEEEEEETLEDFKLKIIKLASENLRMIPLDSLDKLNPENCKSFFKSIVTYQANTN